MIIDNFKKIFKLLNISLLILFLNINFSFAQDNAAVASQNFKETANNLTNNVLATAGTLLMTAAFVLFFYGVVVFIYERATGKNSEAELKKGKDFMLWGLIALFVMVSAWGIIRLAQSLLDIQSNDIKIAPVQFTPMNDTVSTQSGTNPLSSQSSSQQSSSPQTPFGCTTDSECGSGLSCRGSNGSVLYNGQRGTCQQISAPSNPFSDQKYFPTIKIGTDSSIKSQAYGGGSAIEYLISLLIDKNCIANGTIDYTTYNATDITMVKTFQQANNISVDGVVGPSTWEALVTEAGQKTGHTPIITVKNCQ